jgi:glycosyltransferase involved in cell wall biosynthesis
MAAYHPASASTGIAICTVGELFGGVERHVLELLRQLQARGITPVLLLFHDRELAAQARGQGIEPIVLRDHNLLIPHTARRLAAVLEQHHIGLVHVHGYKATVICCIARLWRRFQIVKTVHGLPELPTGNRTGAMRARLYHLLDAAASRIAGARMCYVTEDLRAYHSRKQPADGEVIANGIAPVKKDTLQRPPEFQPTWFNLALVGRLETVKGPHVAIDALATRGLPGELHLHLIGTGPCERELRGRAQELGISERVHFLGFRRNVHNFIAHCDVLVMSSLHEGLPYTLLEGMALGVPIVASRVGGLAEVLQDEVSALLVAPRDPACLASALLRLYQDPELGRRLSARAQHIQRERYSVDTMAMRYLSLYRSLLAVESQAL